MEQHANRAVKKDDQQYDAKIALKESLENSD